MSHPIRIHRAGSRRVRATLYISEEILQEARDAAVHLAGNPMRMTLAKLADRALRAELDRLRAEFTAGEPFPKRGEDLQGGRPIAA